jgi:hypothetical protein
MRTVYVHFWSRSSRRCRRITVSCRLVTIRHLRANEKGYNGVAYQPNNVVLMCPLAKVMMVVFMWATQMRPWQ